MPPWIFSKFVMPKLIAFEQQYPELQLDFSISDNSVNVVNDAQDIAIRVGKLTDSALLSRKIVNNQRILCVAPSYIEKYGMPTSFEQLQTHFWVCLLWQRQLKLIDDNGKPVNFNVKTRFMISNSDNMTQAAIAGHGIAIKSNLAIKDELQRGSLLEVLPGILADNDSPVWFLRPQNSLTTRKTEVFYDFMRSLFDSPET